MKKYLLAARLRTLPLSLSGIILGTALAYSNGFFNLWISVLALCTTIGFQVVSNFANDYGDGIKGTDADRVGEKRLVASGEISPQAMKRAVVLSSLISLVLALLLIYVSFKGQYLLYSLLFFILGIGAIVSAIKYTVGKNAYGYSGLGDVFVFLFFGWVSVLGVFFLFSKSVIPSLLLPATSIGLLSTAVLNLNNMRDQYNDLKANKRTLVVKLGFKNAKIYHYTLLFLALVCAVVYTLLNYQTPYQFIFLIAYVPLVKHVLFVINTSEVSQFDGELKKVALSTFLFAILFGLGLLVHVFN